MSDLVEKQIATQLAQSFSEAVRSDAPYRHWILNNFFPQTVAADLLTVGFPVADLGGVSGKRELHNDTRRYVDEANRASLPVFDAVAQAFQDSALVKCIEDFTGADLDGTYLRIEYAQDITGFWLEPHTDLGVKRLTILIYLSEDEDHNDLGTDI
ncbi:MAG: 2OG-Fe(II) oxygenase, partial [Hyphococcus sp.]